jgi:hypothetical protein
MTYHEELPRQKSLDQRARRAARRVGFVAKRSRRHVDGLDNQGEFMVIDPSNNFPVAGFKYDMTAVDVIEYCCGD